MSSTYVAKWRGPYIIVKGVEQSLTLDIYTSAGAGTQITPNAADTLTIKRGTTTVGTADTQITSNGPPAAYTLTAGSTSSLTVDPDERWRVEWTLTVTGSTTATFVRPAYLTTFDVYPQIIDSDLTDLEPGLAQILGSAALTTFGTQRSQAWDEMIGDLYDRSIRAHQVEDGSKFVRPHLYLTIANVYGFAATTLNDPLYGAKSESYRRRYEAKLTETSWPIDADESGAADDMDADTAAASYDIYGERPRVG